MPDLSRIPQPVRRKAFEIVRGQAAVPQSPLIRAGDRVELCLAAALVVAATESIDERRAMIDRFEVGGRNSVVEAFGEFGWGKELGLSALTTNDAFGETERKDAVLKLLA